MRFKPSCAFTWGQEPIDTRIGIMFGSQYDWLLQYGDKDATTRCLRVDLVIGLLWVNIRLGAVFW